MHAYVSMVLYPVLRNPLAALPMAVTMVKVKRSVPSSYEPQTR